MEKPKNLEKKIKLEFRAKLPEGGYFNQNNQYLTSFLRRVLMFWKVSHPKYMDGSLEEKLEININGEWTKCNFK